MPYNRVTTPLHGVYVLQPDVHEDERGYFYESFNCRDFAETTGTTHRFVQDNQSSSRGGTIRGLHYQLRQPQGKLIRVVNGAVYDVCVDLRVTSPTFGQWFGVLLSAENKLHLWIPPGLAHGFLSMTDVAETVYKATDYWNKQDEKVLLWSDPDLAIDWPLSRPPVVTERDRKGNVFKRCEYYD